MAKKKISIGTLIFGLLFIALGVFLMLKQKDSPPVILISGLDILFGVTLICGSLLGKYSGGKKAENDYFADTAPAAQPVGEPELTEAVSDTAESSDEDDYFEDDILPEAPQDLDPAQLAAREGELRIAAQRAAEEANRAKKAATLAVQEAKQAEDELTRAEDELAQLDPAEQRAAMRRIDMLAQTAAEKSEIAVNEAKRAKLAIRSAREAAELHSMAMDAAAAALSGEDEFADFN